MRHNRIVLIGLALAAAGTMAACDPQPAPDASGAPPAPATTSAAPAATGTPESTGVDPVTAKACADIKKDLDDNADKIAKAEKIGPPAGHLAVSAQWAAGSAAVIAHAIGADATVSAAADKVQSEMMALSDATSKSAEAKPSRKMLEATIKELTAACSAT